MTKNQINVRLVWLMDNIPYKFGNERDEIEQFLLTATYKGNSLSQMLIRCNDIYKMCCKKKYKK